MKDDVRKTAKRERRRRNERGWSLFAGHSARLGSQKSSLSEEAITSRILDCLGFSLMGLGTAPTFLRVHSTSTEEEKEEKEEKKRNEGCETWVAESKRRGLFPTICLKVHASH